MFLAVVRGSRTARQDSVLKAHECPQRSWLEGTGFGEAGTFIEVPLCWLVVGQQHHLTHVGETILNPGQQRLPQTLPLALGTHQDVLDVADRGVIGDDAHQAHQVSFVMAGRHHKRGPLDRLQETVGGLRVGLPPHGGVQRQQLLRGELGVLGKGDMRHADIMSPRLPAPLLIRHPAHQFTGQALAAQVLTDGGGDCGWIFPGDEVPGAVEFKEPPAGTEPSRIVAS